MNLFKSILINNTKNEVKLFHYNSKRHQFRENESN